MTDESTAPDREQSRIQLDRVYLKDVSFESPHTPAIFAAEEGWQPKMNLHLETAAQHIDGDRFEVTLGVTVTATDGEHTVFLVELKQAGLFRLTGFEEAERNRQLGIACPNILFPFARENLDHLVQKGGMPQLLLQPINFENLHAQQAARQATPAGAAEPGAGGNARDG